MGNVLVAFIRLYQRYLSPFLGNHCRFFPSCSQYAVEAIRERGVIVGSGLALWRLARCQPLCRGGYDPVPLRHRHSA